MSFSWSREPRLGEAKRPGPGCGFDDPDLDVWSDLGERWSDSEASDGEQSLPPSDGAESPPAVATPSGAEFAYSPDGVGEWLAKHRLDDFVPVPCKKKTKASKFQGERPGWYFTHGSKGAWLLQRHRTHR